MDVFNVWNCTIADESSERIHYARILSGAASNVLDTPMHRRIADIAVFYPTPYTVAYESCVRIPHVHGLVSRFVVKTNVFVYDVPPYRIGVYRLYKIEQHVKDFRIRYGT